MSKHPDHTYFDLLARISSTGERRDDRTGTGTISLFGPQMEFNLLDGFPILTTKSVSWKNVWTELYWFLKGDTNVNFLKSQRNNIWNQWCDADGNLGPVYGKQWRAWPAAEGSDTPIDQINELINNLRNNPNSRRHVISAWNPSVLPDESMSHAENVAAGKQALPPCHTMFQFYVSTLTLDQRLQYADKHMGIQDIHRLKTAAKDKINAFLTQEGVPVKGLSCKLYQRSADMFLGVPYNLASYAALTTLLATMTNMAPLRFIHTFGDAHIYVNHVDQISEQYDREPKDLPYLDVHDRVRGYISIDELRLDDVKLVGYSPHPAIKAPIAI